VYDGGYERIKCATALAAVDQTGKGGWVLDPKLISHVDVSEPADNETDD
jgi:hypothetical protein